ncbi:MAG: L,D-transpeptidase [Clostridiales bacterium]|nr:L,D-transpeptidase [Clostridiales bacterium]
MAVLVALGLGACSQVLDTLNTAAEAVPTPMPVQTLEPVVTYGEAMTMPLLDTSVLPEGYTAVDIGDASKSLYAFTDSDGAVQYRVYGGYTEFINGVAGDTYQGFYPSDETGAILAEKEAFVDTASEPFGVCEIQPLPDTIRLRTMYTMLENGLITSTAGGAFVYGSFNGGDGAFYPADGTGAMIPGALASDERISVPSYTPETPPTEDGERLIHVYIGTESIVVFKAVDGEWTEERVMICSTGRTKELTPRGTFHIVRQYVYKKMGQIAGENVYSQYASRIYGSYLFHSVPIGGEKRAIQENGKKQMYVKYYEQLGTTVSGGCVRLRVIDAYWIYMNCSVGTTIVIADDNGPTPPTPAALIYEEPYMDARHQYGWDPSDPDPENPYHAIYTPEVILDGPVADKSKD